MTLRLATGPVCWGVDFADRPANPPWQAVIAGAAEAGYEGLELGPLGYLPQDADLGGLEVTAGFVFEHLHEPGRLPAIERLAVRTAERVRAAGGHFLVIIAAVTPERAATAGREAEAPRLCAGDRETLRRAVDVLATVARSAALQPVVHPHAGTHVEFPDEIAPLAELSALCLDSGHLAYAGIDPAAAAREWPVGYVHLKDLEPERVQRDFWSSVRAGAFTPLGGGAVDLAAFLAALGDAGYDGWAAVEQDRDAEAPGDPVRDLRASREHLEELMTRCG